MVTPDCQSWAIWAGFATSYVEFCELEIGIVVCKSNVPKKPFKHLLTSLQKTNLIVNRSGLTLISLEEHIAHAGLGDGAKEISIGGRVDGARHPQTTSIVKI